MICGLKSHTSVLVGESPRKALPRSVVGATICSALVECLHQRIFSRLRVMSERGWHIDEETLLPVIDDEQEFREAHADDLALEALIALWSGRPIDAEGFLLRLLAETDSPRMQALLADAWRDQGRHTEAIQAYLGLVADAVGSPGEAAMRQHLGKAYFAAGCLEEARSEFSQALALRLRDGAEPNLVASSRLALERATALISAP